MLRSFFPSQMDVRFQRGGWRPVPRFLITQPCGKQRLIDDAKKGSHNLATSMTETIYTIGIDLLPVLVDGMARSVSQEVPDHTLPEWFIPTACIMDLPDAYRGCPVEPHQQCYTIAATVSLQHRAWRFWVYTGLMYGLSSAVLSFNRLPTLLVAAARRLLGLCVGAYFDDLFDLSVSCNALESQDALLHVLSLAGSPPAPGKTQPPRSAFLYLGAAFDLTDVLTDHVVHCGPTAASVSKIRDAVHRAVSTRSLTPAQASKLRGQAGWAGSLLHGKCGRLALRFLKTRQYAADQVATVSDFEARELQLLLLVAEQAPSRVLPVLQPAKRPVVIYSDASFEQGQARCGWVIFRPGCRPVGQTVRVTPDWLAVWKPRETQIFAAEAFCSLLVPFNLPSLLADQDLLWFVDNEAAASAMIRGSSGSTDVDQIVQHLLSCSFASAHGFGSNGSTPMRILQMVCLGMACLINGLSHRPGTCQKPPYQAHPFAKHWKHWNSCSRTCQNSRTDGPLFDIL